MKIRDLINIVEAAQQVHVQITVGKIRESTGPRIGSIIGASQGSDFDQVTHYFVLAHNGFRQVTQVSASSYELTDNLLPNLKEYSRKYIVHNGPMSGERLVTPIQMVGFPDGTEFYNSSNKPMRVRGDKIEFEGQLYDLKFAFEPRLR